MFGVFRRGCLIVCLCMLALSLLTFSDEWSAADGALHSAYVRAGGPAPSSFDSSAPCLPSDCVDAEMVTFFETSFEALRVRLHVHTGLDREAQMTSCSKKMDTFTICLLGNRDQLRASFFHLCLSSVMPLCHQLLFGCRLRALFVVQHEVNSGHFLPT